MRTMVKRDSGTELNVLCAVVLQNGWEYFVSEMDKDTGIGFGLVCGFEDELGSFSVKEIEPHIVSACLADDLVHALPAPGWDWKD